MKYIQYIGNSKQEILNLVNNEISEGKKKLNQNLDERLSEIFGNASDPFKEKFQRQREYLKKSYKLKRRN